MFREFSVDIMKKPSSSRSLLFTEAYHTKHQNCGLSNAEGLCFSGCLLFLNFMFLSFGIFGAFPVCLYILSKIFALNLDDVNRKLTKRRNDCFNQPLLRYQIVFRLPYFQFLDFIQFISLNIKIRIFPNFLSTKRLLIYA